MSVLNKVHHIKHDTQRCGKGHIITHCVLVVILDLTTAVFEQFGIEQFVVVSAFFHHGVKLGFINSLHMSSRHKRHTGLCCVR